MRKPGNIEHPTSNIQHRSVGCAERLNVAQTSQCPVEYAAPSPRPELLCSYSTGQVSQVSQPARWWRVAGILAAVVIGIPVVLVFTGLLHAQQMTGIEAMDFKIQLEMYPPPNETQVKTLLEGAKAEPGPNGRILLSAASVKTFETNGTLQLVADAPKCVFDSTGKTVSSDGALKVHTADGKFVLEGQGFVLQQTNSDLVISNNVHTIIWNMTDRLSKP